MGHTQETDDRGQDLCRDFYMTHIWLPLYSQQDLKPSKRESLCHLCLSAVGEEVHTPATSSWMKNPMVAIILWCMLKSKSRLFGVQNRWQLFMEFEGFFFLWHFSKWKVTSPYKLENTCRLYKVREFLKIKRVIKW